LNGTIIIARELTNREKVADKVRSDENTIKGECGVGSRERRSSTT
jgi:hypothetical protein